MRKEDFERNLTEIEIPCLSERLNLADGHAYRSWTDEEARIFSDASKFFFQYDRRAAERLEAEYVDEFLSAAGETLVSERFLICLTASMSIELVANHLRLEKARVGLIEPCFDNLADILKRHGVPLVPISEECLTDPLIVLEKTWNQVDALFLVNPNNPTGLSMSKESFTALCQACSEAGKLLIVDNAFRVYKACSFNQLEIARQQGTKYVSIEDTGKTWPTMELKLSILVCSNDLFGSLYRIYSDFLLHVSPFVLLLLTAFVRLSRKDQFQTIRSIVRRNRAFLVEKLQDSGVVSCEVEGLSVAWLRLPHTIQAHDFVRVARGEGVCILPGTFFYWNSPRSGERFVRIALLRDRDMFEDAILRLSSLLRQKQIASSVVVC